MKNNQFNPLDLIGQLIPTQLKTLRVDEFLTLYWCQHYEGHWEENVRMFEGLWTCLKCYNRICLSRYHRWEWEQEKKFSFFSLSIN